MGYDVLLGRVNGITQWMFGNMTQSGTTTYGFDYQGLYMTKTAATTQADYYVGLAIQVNDPGYNMRYFTFKTYKTIVSYTSPASVNFNVSKYVTGSYVKNITLVQWQNGYDYYGASLVSQTYTFTGINRLLIFFDFNINTANMIVAIPFLAMTDFQLYAPSTPQPWSPYYGWNGLNSTTRLQWYNITIPVGNGSLNNFQIRLAQDPGFTINVVFYSVNRSRLYYDLVTPLGLYYWDIRANSTLFSGWSNTMTFQILPYAQVYVSYYQANGWGYPGGFTSFKTFVNGTFWGALPINFLETNGKRMNLTVTDYFNNRLYQRNYLINATPTYLTVQISTYTLRIFQNKNQNATVAFSVSRGSARVLRRLVYERSRFLRRSSLLQCQC